MQRSKKWFWAAVALETLSLAAVLGFGWLTYVKMSTASKIISEAETKIAALEQKVKNRTLELEKTISDFQRLQGEAKNKEIEISELNKQIDILRPKSAYSQAGKKVIQKLKNA